MKRFGKRRVPGCECDTNYTCGPCLRDAPPPIFTGTESGKQYPRPPVDLCPQPHAPASEPGGRP